MASLGQLLPLFFGGFADVNIFQDKKLCKTNPNSPGLLEISIRRCTFKKNLKICLTLKLFMLAHTLKSPKQEDQGEFEASLS